MTKKVKKQNQKNRKIEGARSRKRQMIQNSFTERANEGPKKIATDKSKISMNKKNTTSKN